MSLLYTDGYFPFCIPTQVNGKDIELWDGETTFEEGGMGDRGPFSQTLASNSSSELTPVVGNGCGWVEISLEAAMKLYWRVRLLDFAENEIFSTLTAKTQYQTVEAEVTATKIDGIPKEKIQNYASLVCSKQQPWEESNYPKFDFEGEIIGEYGGAPDFPFLGNVPATPYVNGSISIETSLIDPFVFYVDAYIAGFLPTNIPNFRQIKGQPDKFYVALSSIFYPPDISYLTNWGRFGNSEGGIILVADELVGRKDFGNQSDLSYIYELSDQSATVTILGESNTVKIMKYAFIDSYPVPRDNEEDIQLITDEIMIQYPTPFTYPDVEIVAKEYFTYGSIYNEDTGEQV